MLQPREAETTTLLQARPDPVETVNADGRSRFVLTCEHAGRAVPERLSAISASAPAEMDRHIASDVGAEGLSRAAVRDCSTRRWSCSATAAWSSTATGRSRHRTASWHVSDGTPVPANGGSCRAGAPPPLRGDPPAVPRGARRDLLDRRSRAGGPSILVAVHSFTPRLVGGQRCGRGNSALLSNRDGRFAEALPETISAPPTRICSARAQRALPRRRPHRLHDPGARRGAAASRMCFSKSATT